MLFILDYSTITAPMSWMLFPALLSVSNALHANPFLGINEPNELIIPFPANVDLVTTCHTLHYATMRIWRCSDVQVLFGDQSKLALELLLARLLALGIALVLGMSNQIGQRNWIT